MMNKTWNSSSEKSSDKKRGYISTDHLQLIKNEHIIDVLWQYSGRTLASLFGLQAKSHVEHMVRKWTHKDQA
jgi:hypothetical protein